MYIHRIFKILGLLNVVLLGLVLYTFVQEKKTTYDSLHLWNMTTDTSKKLQMD